MTRGSSQTADKFMVRMPDGMRTWIKIEAAKALRSANAQIVWMLQRQIDESQTTAGRSLPATPAVVPERDALQGGSSTHGS